jgi:hypothetical protein
MFGDRATFVAPVAAELSDVVPRALRERRYNVNHPRCRGVRAGRRAGRTNRLCGICGRALCERIATLEALGPTRG